MTIEDFDNIPILDLSYAEDPSKKPFLLQKLRHILFNVGFLYISNTGVSHVQAHRVPSNKLESY